jgi:S1-C subfamily serine protease
LAGGARQVYELAREEGGFGFEISDGGHVLDIAKASAAAAAGMPASHDESVTIVAVNGKAVKSKRDIVAALGDSPTEQPVAFTCRSRSRPAGGSTASAILVFLPGTQASGSSLMPLGPMAQFPSLI